VTAVAAIAGVAAGMSAGPAAAATSNPPSASSSAGIVLTAHLTGTAPQASTAPQAGTAQQAGSPGAAVTALPFDQAAASARQSPLGKAAHAGTSAPLGQSAPAGPLATQVPDQDPAPAPQHPGSVNVATAQTSNGGSASQPTAPAGSTASPPPAPAAAPPAPAPAPAPRPQPFRLYDSVTPQAIPPGAPVATYATGGYAVPASAVAGRSLVLWIDTRGTDPAAQALDVEPGDATPAVAAAWASARLTQWPNKVARIYTMISEWPAVKAAIASLPPQMQSHVHYWIADPTGVPHIVPGSMATQWYWGPHWDISTALPGF
jgi:hypothetical protein